MARGPQRFLLVPSSLAVCLCSVLGCAAAPKAGPGTALSAPESPGLLAAFQQRAAQVSALRAIVRLQYRDTRESFSSREALIVARPDRLRVEALSFVGTTFVLTAADGNMVTYIPREHVAYVGEATAESLWRYVGLWIPIEELVDLLLATPGHQQPLEADCPQVTPGAVRCFQYGGESGEATVWLDPLGLPRRVVQEGRDGTILWTAAYESFDRGQPFPAVQKLVFESPVFGRRVTLQFHDIEVNPPLLGEEFTLALPPGVRTVSIDEVTP